MLTIDHVVIAVTDLDAAAVRFREAYGLDSVAGGRHAGHGTANRIVPLADCYLELVAVVDAGEAAGSPFGSWVQQSADRRDVTPIAVCLRADDLDAIAARLGTRPQPMQRTRPDGVVLSWELLAVDAAIADGLPFFIRWHVADTDLPGRQAVEHQATTTGIAWLEIGGDRARLAAWLGPHDLPLRPVGGEPGPHRLAVGVTGGEPIIIDG